MCLAALLFLYLITALQCTGLTCSRSIYSQIEALKVSTGIKYVTAEDSCCGCLRVTVETHGPTTNNRIGPSSVVCSTSTLDCTSIRKNSSLGWWLCKSEQHYQFQYL